MNQQDQKTYELIKKALMFLAAGILLGVGMVVALKPNLLNLPSVEKPEKNIYKCPNKAWIDCMPTIGEEQRFECSQEYLKWAKDNCPGFEGAAI